MVKYDLKIIASITGTAAFADLTTYIRTQVTANNIHQEIYDSTSSSKANIVVHSDTDPTTLRTNIKTKLDLMVTGLTCTSYEIRTIEFTDLDTVITYP